MPESPEETELHKTPMYVETVASRDGFEPHRLELDHFSLERFYERQGYRRGTPGTRLRGDAPEDRTETAVMPPVRVEPPQRQYVVQPPKKRRHKRP